MAMQTPKQLAADLLASSFDAPVRARSVVKRAAQNVKDESRANVQRSAPVHNGGAFNAITYDDPTVIGSRIRTEVGYDRDIRAGRLGNLLEYGGAGDKSPAHRDIGRAADAEEPRFEDAIRTMAQKLL